MDEKINVLKENQQILGSKISMLQETNRKKDEEADRIRELIAECRENLNRIKCGALKSQKQETPCGGRPEPGTSGTATSPSEPDSSQTRNKYLSENGQYTPCGAVQFQSSEDPCEETPDDPCARFSSLPLQNGNQKSPCGSKLDTGFARYRSMKPCEATTSNDPCGKTRSGSSSAKDPCGDNTSTPTAPTNPCESRIANIKIQMSALADAKEKSRQCIEKLGEKMEKEVKMRIVQENSDGSPKFGCSGHETDRYQERVSCKVDLSRMKVNIRGPPEDLKKLDAMQLINLLDKFQCQELVITTGDNESQLGFQTEVPVFYITHPGNLVFIVGIVMVAFLVNANMCSPRRGCRTKFLLNMLYLGSFAFHYGIVLWMSFIRGLTLSMGLPRDIFNVVDNLILPKYFSICVFLSAITLYSFLATHCTTPCTSWPLPVMVQIIIEAVTFLIELLTICYIVPAIVKLREIIDGFKNLEDDSPLPESYRRYTDKLTKLNRTITIINLLIVMFMGSNMYYITSKLNLG